MKKFIVLALVTSFGFFSCGGEEKKEGGSASLCDCVNQKKSEASDACKKMQDDFKKEYESADESRKTEMEQEIMDCKANK